MGKTKSYLRKGNILEIFSSRHNVRVPNKAGEEKSEWKWNGYLYFKSVFIGYKYRKDLESVKCFCLFLGYPRSGHSVIGSILDAHRNMVIAHELDSLTLSERGFSGNQIESLILDNSNNFAKIGRAWSGYDYRIEGLWQGSYKKLLVVGDKIGGWSSRLIARDESILDRFKENIGLELKFIHHVRNPYDIISRRVLRRKRKKVTKEDIDDIFLLAEAIDGVHKKEKKDNFFECHHRDFIKQPKKYIQNLVEFLGLKATDDYLNKTSGIVKHTLSTPRYDVYWSKKLIGYTRGIMENYAFYRRYKY